MATYHIRVNPKNVPDDWRDDSLRRTAIHLNQAGKIPAVFSEDSLEYLRELPNLLMRQGVFIFAHEFIPQLALATISAENSTDAKEMFDLEQLKEEAVFALLFEVAAQTVDKQPGLWLHSQNGGVDSACAFLQHLLQKFDLPDPVTFEWSHDCSKPRTDAYGGGAAIVTAQEIKTMSTSRWLEEQTAALA